MQRKLIVIINGKGETGKDTLCNSLSGKYNIMNISAIDPIKEIARQHGWRGEKDDKARLFLAELKRAFINYNNLPTEYLKNKTEEFLNSSAEMLFVHIRESDQIDQYKRAIHPNRCVTLLVKRAMVDNYHWFGNAADDEVEHYDYDLIFENDLPIEESTAAFCTFIESIK